MNGSSVQDQTVSLEAYHGELEHPILKEKLTHIIQSVSPQIHVTLLKTALVWPHEASVRVGIYSSKLYMILYTQKIELNAGGELVSYPDPPH